MTDNVYYVYLEDYYEDREEHGTRILNVSNELYDMYDARSKSAEYIEKWVNSKCVAIYTLKLIGNRYEYVEECY